MTGWEIAVTVTTVCVVVALLVLAVCAVEPEPEVRYRRKGPTIVPWVMTETEWAEYEAAGRPPYDWYDEHEGEAS